MIDTLRTHPIIGMGTAAGGFLTPFIEAISPVLQLTALVIGICIGGLTLAIKWREYNGKKGG